MKKKSSIFVFIGFLMILFSCHQTIIPNLPVLPEPEEPPPSEGAIIDTTNAPQASRAERIEWLQNNVFPLHSMLPNDDDYSDLEPLKQHIGTSRIVILGEQTPWDGLTQLAKTRLVKFLHQVMGFDVIAFESGVYDTWKAWTEIQSGKDVTASFRNAVPFYWGYSQQMEDLIDYIEQNVFSDRPLNLLGIDCEFTGMYSREIIYWELDQFVKSIGVEVQEYPGWAVFTCLLEKLANHDNEAPDPDRQSIYFDTITKLLTDISGEASPSNPEAAMWQQIIESAEREAKRRWWEWGLQDRNPPPDYWNEKSDQMARNLLAFANTVYPDKKIIVWAQSRHVCRRIGSEVTNRYGHIVTDGMTSMVDRLWDVMGPNIYALIFTASQGTFAPYFGLMQNNVGPVFNGDFEDLMNEADFDLAYLDLRNLNDYHSPEANRLLPANGAWFRDGLIMSPMQYIRMKALDWTHVIDGVIFTREMTPSTRSPD